MEKDTNKNLTEKKFKYNGKKEEVLKDFDKMSFDEKFDYVEKEIKKRTHEDMKEFFEGLNETMYYYVYGEEYSSDFFKIKEKMSEIVISHLKDIKFLGRKKFTNLNKELAAFYTEQALYDLPKKYLEKFRNYPCYDDFEGLSDDEVLELLFEDSEMTDEEIENLDEEEIALAIALFRAFSRTSKIGFTPRKYENYINHEGELEENCSRYALNDDTINISQTKSIEDSSVLMHEFMHYMNFNRDVQSEAADHFTEPVSTFSQLYFGDYIAKNFPYFKSEVTEVTKDYAFWNLIWINVFSKVLFSFIHAVENGEYISYQHVVNIANDIQSLSGIKGDFISKQVVNFIMSLDSKKLHEYLTFYATNYTESCLLGCHMFNIYKENNKIAMVTDISEGLEKNSIAKMYKMMDLVKNEKPGISANDNYEIRKAVILEHLRRMYAEINPGKEKEKDFEFFNKINGIDIEEELKNIGDTSYSEVELDYDTLEKNFIKTRDYFWRQG